MIGSRVGGSRVGGSRVGGAGVPGARARVEGTDYSIGVVRQRELHRIQRPHYWREFRGERYLAMDRRAFGAVRGDVDLLVCRTDGDRFTRLFVAPVSRFVNYGILLNTRWGEQIGLAEREWMVHNNPARQMSMFDGEVPVPPARKVYDPLVDGLAANRHAAEISAKFATYHAANPGKWMEFITAASFVLDMGWGEREMSALLSMIACDNNYKAIYRRMLVNFDNRLGRLIQVQVRTTEVQEDES